MKNVPGSVWRLFVAVMFVGISLAVSGYPAAQASNNGGFTLPKSPISASTLVAQAIHAGHIQLGQQNAPGPNLTCSPAPCVLPNSQASAGGQPNNEDPIAANPANAQQLLSGANDYNCPSLQGFFNSSDAGTTWIHTCMNTLPGFSGDGDPGVGYDLNGTAYIAGIDGSGSTGEIVFEKSTDNGVTYSAPKVAVTSLLGGLTDKDWLQIDDSAASPLKNSLYISVTQFAANSNNDEISLSHSIDGGTTWVTKAVDNEQIYPSVDQFSDIAIGRSGTVYVSWMRCTATGPTGDCGGTAAKLLVSKSVDGGNTFTAPTTIATVQLAPDSCGAFYGCVPNTGERVSEIPAIGVDNTTGPKGGNLYAVMYNYTGTQMRVEVAVSSNGGTSFSNPLPVAPATETHDQFFPWLSVSPTNGTVGITWLDRRDDPANISYAAYGTVSSGAGLAADHRIATALSNPNNDGFGGTFMGDYTGNVWTFDGHNLFASWMDSRSGINMQDWVGGGRLS